ncbi:MAG: nucleotidyltransferase [Candidatus Sabulitectum sp.]|nr:nucleotidyltransferase [Candidatus Sabulitectum sp.]
MGLRQLPEDFKEFIQFLNDHDVHYLLLGGWAVGLYGNPRATGDIDFLIATDDNNIEKLQQALLAFGAPTVANEVFQEKGNVFRMGRSPVQIDIINDADGISFSTCYERRNIIEIDDISISVISRNDLIVNKMASGRHRDLADVVSMESQQEHSAGK